MQGTASAAGVGDRARMVGVAGRDPGLEKETWSNPLRNTSLGQTMVYDDRAYTITYSVLQSVVVPSHQVLERRHVGLQAGTAVEGRERGRQEVGGDDVGLYVLLLVIVVVDRLVCVVPGQNQITMHRGAEHTRSMLQNLFQSPLKTKPGRLGL